MGLKNDLIDIRDEYINLVKSELLGPGSEYSIPDAEHEIITTSPEKRYSIGILFPQEIKINSESDDSLRIEENILDTEDDDTILDEIDISEETNSLKRRDQIFDSEEENLDEQIGLATQNLPSSMGITFLIKGEFKIVICDVEFATYIRASLLDCKIPFIPAEKTEYKVPSQLQHLVEYDIEENCLKPIAKFKIKDIYKIKESDTVAETDYEIFDKAYKLCNQINTGYKRIPHFKEMVLDFTHRDFIEEKIEIDGTNSKITALRRKITDNTYSVTIMIVNNYNESPKGENCIFQPHISVSTEKNEFSFCEINNSTDTKLMDDEELSLALLYRNKKTYGTGLGTSVGWKIDEHRRGVIYSNYFPETEVPSMDFDLPKETCISKETLSIKFLSDLNKTSKIEKIEKLNQFISSYENWIIKIGKGISQISDDLQAQAKRNIQNCKKACERMQAGISELASNNTAWDAFAIANRAMYMQREHLKIQYEMSNKDRYPYDEELAGVLEKINYNDTEDIYYWRPFQLAFFLMSIKSMTNDTDEYRDIVDLIWFPTGGGKTEAYLALTAFTIFYRRLSYLEISNGTTVIMRYTLRLLAAQQFTRAATLICACEYIRLNKPKNNAKYISYSLGSDPITIGLWIGGNHTPNKNDKARENLDKLISSNEYNLKENMEKFNKFQVLKCPWCGTKLVKGKENDRMTGIWGYKMKGKHFYMSCPNELCDFNSNLPIQIIDEELYLNPPTLLFGTVDKFAMLPWKSEVGNFFASNNRNRAPELIIQDELHLISGPLGTMVGLYETAINALCQQKGVKPKIVASTATIRRAKEQCSVLYNRDVVQFPSPGIDSDDSFFARELLIDYENGRFGRKYVGLMPSGKTKAMMEVRAISALLQKVNIMDLSDDERDKLWTLTIYFNSLKDLGKCTTLIEDDVRDFIKRSAYRLGTARDARLLGRADELTSRVSTTELNDTLDKLEKLCYSKENIQNRKYASNTLLATNMISVGIDVARLNVMLLVGQPKLTSEYIQASSRIGRSYPGVAFTLYDGSKSRDRSHYEQFESYHDSFYKFVEPTGATPFSEPARNRALHAVIVSIMRHIEKLTLDNDAGKFDKTNYIEAITRTKKYIIDRVNQVNERSSFEINDESISIENEIDRFFEDWNMMTENSDRANIYFGERFMFKQPENNQRRLLKSYGTSPYEQFSYDTLTSMRNVDCTVASNIIIWEEQR